MSGPLLRAVLLAAWLGVSTPHALAQPAPAASAAPAMSEGEIRKVDKEAGKLTIRHGEIRNLDMPPMTMVFRVRDAGLLDKLKAGDKVRFVAEKLDGAYVVTTLQPAN